MKVGAEHEGKRCTIRFEDRDVFTTVDAMLLERHDTWWSVWNFDADSRGIITVEHEQIIEVGDLVKPR